MLKEFKEFIMRGNVLDLAVGVIIGGAFTALVTSLTNNLINPIIGVFTGTSGLTKLSFSVLGAKFTYGAFLNDVINFLIVAFVVFILVRSINRLFPKKEAAPAGPTKEEELLTEIRDLLAKK
ncbi:large-conductance mechanosensitive channel protein MscL [Lacticaseibacillus daqingensis]|uniref:large-conductance mechanosensitive channel protein MscL n=1 Tax=Lacticaseibacillus daqingensis TaxID=2486014 RepID=UPI000F7B6F4C|nr:large-conductance mechanosensitive channel protein MscL [Lacticaseibacillus daqingensis]